MDCCSLMRTACAALWNSRVFLGSFNAFVGPWSWSIGVAPALAASISSLPLGLPFLLF